jgi:UDP-GlcNAc3NAcA epimerase
LASIGKLLERRALLVTVMQQKPKIISVVGARPQFVKLAPLARALAAPFRHKIVHTGQHYDENMSRVFFRQLGIPRANSNLGLGGTSHADMTGRMLIELEKKYAVEKPDLVIVYGDTNTTLAGALAAAKMGIPVGHIEAGMRSYVETMPEEINRRLTDHMSRLLFCPTPLALKNLKAEGVHKGLVHSGDLMFELLDRSRRAISRNGRVLKTHGLQKRGYLYLTVHRAANVDVQENLDAVIDILGDLDMPVLFPIHPRTRERVRRFKLKNKLCECKNVIVTEPLNYLDNLTAVTFAHTVLTDSGGLQKEALFLGTPVLTLRNETEWEETLTRGNTLVGLSKTEIHRALATPARVRQISYRIRGKRPSQIIVSEIRRFLRGR